MMKQAEPQGRLAPARLSAPRSRTGNGLHGVYGEGSGGTSRAAAAAAPAQRSRAPRLRPPPSKAAPPGRLRKALGPRVARARRAAQQHRRVCPSQDSTSHRGRARRAQGAPRRAAAPALTTGNPVRQFGTDGSPSVPSPCRPSPPGDWRRQQQLSRLAGAGARGARRAAHAAARFPRRGQGGTSEGVRGAAAACAPRGGAPRPWFAAMHAFNTHPRLAAAVCAPRGGATLPGLQACSLL